MNQLPELKTHAVLPSQFVEEFKTSIGMKVKEVVLYMYTDPSFEEFCDSPNLDYSKEEVMSNPQLFDRVYKEYVDWASAVGTITFDSGLILGLGSDESKNSVFAWVDTTPDGRHALGEALSEDAEDTPIILTSPDFIDPFWLSVVGAKVEAISLLIQAPQTASYEGLPNEVGIVFKLNNGLKMAAVHQLHSEGGDFSLINEARILEHLRPGLTETDIFDL